MLILTGLGNPEPRYAGTRHNVGFMAMDAVAERWRFAPPRRRFQSLAQEGEIPAPTGAVRALILKPQTYYNETGRAVAEAGRFYKAAVEDIVLFYDEIDLAPGRFRMKTGGGAAGNNGVRSAVAALGPGFRRARIGTGHPGHKDQVLAHVLSEFHKSEQGWVRRLCAALAEAAPLLAAGEDEKYQMEVLRLAPAEKKDPRSGEFA